MGFSRLDQMFPPRVGGSVVAGDFGCCGEREREMSFSFRGLCGFRSERERERERGRLGLKVG